MPAYDRTRFEPPAPVAMVTLRNPSSSGSVLPAVALLIDSSSDT
jgi:hypothetical protein